MKEIVLGTDGMTLEGLVAIAREGAAVQLSKESEERIVNARKLIEKWVQEGRTVYGVTINDTDNPNLICCSYDRCC